RACDAVVSLGGELTKLIQTRVGVERGRIVELPNGIDPDWIGSEPTVRCENGVVRFLFVGRYVRLKGVEELYRAINGNPAWQKVATFRFIGPIPEGKR